MNPLNSIRQIAGCLPKGFTTDSLLTVEQFAVWRQVSVDTARRQICAGTVPAILHSRNDVRIHPKTYLEKLLK